MSGNKKALIISISDYDDKKLENLEFCKNDGEKMYSTLTNLDYDIPAERNLIGKVDRKTMKTAIFNFFKGQHGDDTLLFYFSGHGLGDGFGGKFFANTDVDSDVPGIDGVRYEELNEQMERSYAKKIVAIIDCCYSGDIGLTRQAKSAINSKKELEKLGSEGLHKVFDKSQGCCVLASSSSEKKSYSLGDESESAFTHFIIKGLSGTKDSVDKNGFVTPESLSDYAFAELAKIPELKNQNPVKNMATSGKIILAEYPIFSQQKGTTTVQQRILDLLEKEKIVEFNNLRKVNPNRQLKLDDIDLRYKVLEEIDFQKAKLRNAKFDYAKLAKANFSYANLVGTKFREAVLVNVNFTGADLARCDLSSAFLTGSNLIDANFENAELVNADITKANLSRAFLTYADLTNTHFQYSNLSNCELTRAKCMGTNFLSADLSHARLPGAMCMGANFKDANLTSSLLARTDFAAADLSGADLSNADLSYANLGAANLENTNLTNAILKNVDLTLVDLSTTITDGCRGLEDY